MFLIRPITNNDLDHLCELAHGAGFGLTTLPKDRDYLQERVEMAVNSFAKQREKPAGEDYLFVLEDTETGKIIGTTAIISKTGGFEPFYSYRIETRVKRSEVLGIEKEVHTLHLNADHNGPTEICSIYLDEAYRQKKLGKLLSFSRFLFMATFPKRFDPMVLAEMRGVNEDGDSPFWEALGRHFFTIDFPRADLLSMTNKKFIDELMPKEPIYVDLLPEHAQEVMGQVHENTVPAFKMLLKIGFKHENLIDIFEGGPIITCPLEEISVVKNCQRFKSMPITGNRDEKIRMLVAKPELDFRCIETRGIIQGDTLHISDDDFMTLALKPTQEALCYVL